MRNIVFIVVALALGAAPALAVPPPATAAQPSPSAGDAAKQAADKADADAKAKADAKSKADAQAKSDKAKSDKAKSDKAKSDKAKADKAKTDNDKRKLALAIASDILATIAVLVLAWKSEVLRDSQPPDFACAPLNLDGSPAPEKDRYRRSFSLSQTQMTWWFWIVLVSYLYIAWTTEDIFGGLNAQALTLMGIGIGTAIGAAIIDQSKKEKVGPLTDFDAALQKIRDPATPKADIPDWVKQLNAAGKKLKSYGLLPDILSDVSGISLHRFQSVAWTFVLGVAFLINVVTRYQMPVFNGFALTLLGISAGTYLGLKIPETPA